MRREERHGRCSRRTIYMQYTRQTANSFAYVFKQGSAHCSSQPPSPPSLPSFCRRQMLLSNGLSLCQRPGPLQYRYEGDKRCQRVCGGCAGGCRGAGCRKQRGAEHVLLKSRSPQRVVQTFHAAKCRINFNLMVHTSTTHTHKHRDRETDTHMKKKEVRQNCTTKKSSGQQDVQHLPFVATAAAAAAATSAAISYSFFCNVLPLVY